MKLPDILTELNIPFNEAGQSPHVTANWIGVECPWCGVGTGKTGLGFHLNNPKFCTCWRCGPHRTADALMELAKEPYRVIRKLLNSLDVEYAQTERPRGSLILPKSLGPLLPAHKRYLRARKLNPQRLITIWGIQAIGPAANLAWRIFIPFRQQGETVSWTTRTIGKSDRRYISAKPEQESIPMHKMLFGEDYCRHSIIVCEGPFDAMRIGPGAVALAGLQCSNAQMLRISKYNTRIICFDAEPKAQERARRLCDSLSMFPGSTVNVEIDSKDPGEATKKEIKLLRSLL